MDPDKPPPAAAPAAVVAQQPPAPAAAAVKPPPPAMAAAQPPPPALEPAMPPVPAAAAVIHPLVALPAAAAAAPAAAAPMAPPPVAAPPRAPPKPGKGIKALYSACKRGNAAEVSRVLSAQKGPEEQKKLVNTAYGFGRRCLATAALGGHTECARLLVDAGADLECGDSFFGPEGGEPRMVHVGTSHRQPHTPLSLAAEKGHVDTCRLLLDAGARLGGALAAAASGRQIATVTFLIERGARVTDFELHGAVCGSSAELCRLFVERGARVTEETIEHAAIHPHRNRPIIAFLRGVLSNQPQPPPPPLPAAAAAVPAAAAPAPAPANSMAATAAAAVFSALGSIRGGGGGGGAEADDAAGKRKQRSEDAPDMAAGGGAGLAKRKRAEDGDGAAEGGVQEEAVKAAPSRCAIS